jgi:hypothetical protein
VNISILFPKIGAFHSFTGALKYKNVILWETARMPLIQLQSFMEISSLNVNAYTVI